MFNVIFYFLYSIFTYYLFFLILYIYLFFIFSYIVYLLTKLFGNNKKLYIFQIDV